MFKLTPLAEADMLAIGRHTQNKWGNDQRRHYLSELDASFTLLSENPQLGRNRDDIHQGTRSHAIGSHVIWYRIVRTDIEILRLLHRAMEPENHL